MSPSIRPSAMVLLSALLACGPASIGEPGKLAVPGPGPGAVGPGGSVIPGVDPNRDTDGDGIPDIAEDRDQDGQLDPGETSPASTDSDGDSVLDGQEVQTIACAGINDRPFVVIDGPGVDSVLFADERVSAHVTLRTTDNKAPALLLRDPTTDVAAVVVKKRPAQGVTTAAGQRDHEQRSALATLGTVRQLGNRAFRTVQGFDAEQAVYEIEAPASTDARLAARGLASAMLGVPLAGDLPPGGAQDRKLHLYLLTVFRAPTRVVMLAALAAGAAPSEAQTIRLEELTDGTNLARHGSFSHHVCDPFAAEAHAAADIIFVVDDSCSMEDDQDALRSAAAAMQSVLAAARLDYRLGVARMWAQGANNNLIGALEGGGLTTDLAAFQRSIALGAQGGWEPGLDVGLQAIDRLLPRTPAGQTPDPHHLRDGAALLVIWLSDERDQVVECNACGACDAAEHEQRLCQSPPGTRSVDHFVAEYQARGAVAFAIVGDMPSGCRQPGNRDDFEPGQGYVEVANATGGKFGSICGDMERNLQDVGRVATSVASSYQLSAQPASVTLRVAVGPAGRGRAVPRSRTNGFDYDPVQNTIVFFGSAQPADGDEIIVGYRRWDWAGKPGEPPDECDRCPEFTACLPDLDIAQCAPACGDTLCAAGLVCHAETATCVDPGAPGAPGPGDVCGECEAGHVCDTRSRACVLPCETTGCAGHQFCSAATHLCADLGV